MFARKWLGSDGVMQATIEFSTGHPRTIHTLSTALTATPQSIHNADTTAKAFDFLCIYSIFPHHRTRIP
jgi:hypothetical protein